MSPKTDLNEIFVSRGQLMKIGGFTSTDLTDFLARNSITSDPDQEQPGMYPCFAIMRSLNAERKTSNNRKKKITEDGEIDLEKEEKLEKVTKLRIANQREMKALIKRDYAKRRVLTLLSSFSDKMKYIIKSTAVELADLIEREKVKFGGVDARKIEAILTDQYNAGIDKLESEAKIISWEDDDAENQLGRTELSPTAGEVVGGGGSEEDTSPVEE